MTKHESAVRTLKSMIIDACEQLLTINAASGARLAIPGTDSLIMVGTQEWIAKNVPGVEAMVEGALSVDDQWIFELAASHESSYGPITFRSAGLVDFVNAISTRLAATTQASTAQADELKQLRNRVSQLEAARIGYASEFPLNADGEPDVGSIHANIRALKSKLAATSSTDSALAAEARDAAHSWAEGERIANVPIVEDSLRGFSEDPTSDNGVCVVLAVLDALRSATATGSGDE